MSASSTASQYPPRPDTGASQGGPNSVGRSVNRLAEAIGSLNPSRGGRIVSVGSIPLEFFGGVTVGNLQALVNDPYSQEMVDQKCHHCDVVLQCKRIVAPFVACDSCIERHEKEEKAKLYHDYWMKICPEDFRDTSLTFEGFPTDVLKQVKKKDPTRSLFFYGPTGTAKTRVAMLMLYEALLRDQRVGVLWPEKLAGLKSDFDDRGSFERYAAYDVLLMDDALLTAVRASKLIDALKQLIDVRMRHRRPFIITSQIGSEADLKDGKEFGDAKAADIERIKAMLRRLNETCDVVNFARKEGAF